MKYCNCFVRLDILLREFELDIRDTTNNYSNRYILMDDKGIPVSSYNDKTKNRLTTYYNSGVNPVNGPAFPDTVDKMTNSGYIAHSLDGPAMWETSYYILGEQVREADWLSNKLSLLYKMNMVLK